MNLSRRALLTRGLILPTAALAAPFLVPVRARAFPTSEPDTGKGPFILAPLPYDFKALEPNIDAETMELHHDKHHATYVKNLNTAAEKAPEIATKSPEELIKDAGYTARIGANGGTQQRWRSCQPHDVLDTNEAKWWRRTDRRDCRRD